MLNFPDNFYDYVIVQGDTGSALGCSLAAHNRKLKVVHLESGLRTYDLENPFPEESYRQIISRISNINLCPTKLSLDNLISEKVNGECFIVGNTVLDNIVNTIKDCNYGNKVLITLHRRENHDIMDMWFNEINILSELYPNLEFILPIHPNPNVQKHKDKISKKVIVVDPLDHSELIDIMKECKFVISDSGGIQEEATFFNKKTIVCRKTTERPEGINTGHLHLCENPKDLVGLVYLINKDYYINNECPYGDGKSSQKIVKILKDGYSNT